MILFVTYLDQFRFSHLKFILLYLASILTVLYSLKVLYKVFFNKPNGFKKKYEKAHEASPIVLLIYSILIFFSIFSGYLLKDMLIGAGSVYLANSVFYLPKNYTLTYAEFIDNRIKLLVLLIPIFGFIIFTQIKDYNYMSNKYYLLFLFFNKKYFFDRVVNMFNLVVVKLSFDFFYKAIDKGIIESVISFFITLFKKFSQKIMNMSKFNLNNNLKIFYYLVILLLIGLVLLKLYIWVLHHPMAVSEEIMNHDVSFSNDIKKDK